MPRRKHWLRVLLVAAAILIAMGLAASVYVKTYLVPAMVRSRINEALGDYWDGRAEIQRVDISHASKIAFVRGLSVFDRQGRRWLRIDNAAVTLRNWPGLSPVVTDVHIDKLSLTGHADAGNLRPPLRRPPTIEPPADVDLRQITVEQVTVSLFDGPYELAVYDDLHFQASQDAGIWTISLSSTAGPAANELASARIATQPRSAEIRLKIAHELTAAEAALILANAGLEDLQITGGTIRINATAQGGTDAGTWQAHGNVSLANGRLVLNEAPLADKLDITAELQGRRVEFTDVSVEALNGRTRLLGRVDFGPDFLPSYQGQAALADIDLAELAKFLPEDHRIYQGTVRLHYEYFGYGWDIAGLSGNGLVFLDDADVRSVRALRSILARLGLKDLAPAVQTDIEAKFANTGPVLTLDRARLANAVSALDAERGGTINVQTGMVDMYVVGAPLKQAQDLLSTLPGAGLAQAIFGKLIRLHVKGHYSDPPKKLIRKEPLKDIQAGTIDFLLGSARTGGQFGQATADRLGKMFKLLERARARHSDGKNGK